MKKVFIFTFIIMLLASFNLAFADDLNITFEDDSDIANWSHHDETNFYTTEAHDATGGVDGSGALVLGDAGYDMLAKRAVKAVVGAKFSMSMDIKTVGWDDQSTYPIYVTVQGIDDVPDTIYVNAMADFGTVTISGTAVAEDGYIRIKGANTLLANQVFVDNVMFEDGQDLFFSEYIEGSSNNKAIEIYNPTNETKNLDDYIIRTNYNGNPWSGDYVFPIGAVLEPGDVFVAAHNQADAAVVAQADSAYAYGAGAYITSFNGDDVRALCKVIGTDTMYLDYIGLYDMVDPGDGWSVAGTADGTKEHTIVRKETVWTGNTDWTASAGTDADDSEWIVYDQNTFDYLGAHPGMPVIIPDYVNVTVRLNTSTNLDTFNVNHFMELRGALNGDAPGTLYDGNIINWDGSSTLEPTNVGGDYWEVTFQMEPADTLYYKMWTGYTSENTSGTMPGGGWEGPFEVSNGLTWDTRTFISGTADTVLDVQYYHPDLSGAKTEQYFRPFEDKQDTVAIYFRVNMAGATESNLFDPAVNGPVGIRSGPPVGDNDWSEGAFVPLTRETSSVIDGSFWSGTAYVPVDSITTGNTQKYKFFVQNDGGISWESTADRELVLTESMVAAGDTTLVWDWFSGLKYVGQEPVESIITWRVSTEALETLGLFDRGVGDMITVRGPRGWGGDEALELNYNPLLREWTSANETFDLIPGYEISYKYYIKWDPSRLDEASPNYIANLDSIDDGYEEPSIRGGGNRIHVYQDAAQQMVEGDFGFDRQFFCSVPANGVFEHDMDITWNIDMHNAANADSNKDNTLFTVGDSVWIRWDGELMALPQGFDNRSFDVNGFLLLTDPDGDMIYSGTFTVKDVGWYQLGYLVTYKTADGTIVTNGTGNERGRRYYQYIHPTSVGVATLPAFPVTTWPAAFDLPVVSWRAEDLFVESPPPDLLTPFTDIDDKDNVVRKFALHQNYPNPFNPVTTIKYELAKNSNVEITVFDVMGRKIKTLVNSKQHAGDHLTVWNGTNSNGLKVTSGIYFVKMKSSSFEKIRKMTLIK